MKKWAIDSESSLTSKKSLIAVNRITHHWIIQNQKTKKISLVYKFLQVSLSSYF